MKSSLAKLNINLSIQSLAWPTQWAKAKSANPAQHQDIFFEYWWPDYADPYSWFINLLQTEKPPYFNLSYYSNPALDKQINRVETLVATNRDGRAGSCTRRCRRRSSSRPRSTVLYNDNYQYAMRTVVHRLHVQPGLPERRLRATT